MNNTRVIFIVVLTLALLGIQACALPSVSSMLLEIEEEGSFKVINKSDKTKTYGIERKDLDQDFNFLKYGSTSNSLELSVSPKRFTLKPGKSQRVQVFAEQDRSKTEARWAVIIVKELKENIHTGKMEVSTNVAVQVFQYAQQTNANVAITGMTEETITVKNLGNIPEQLSGKIEIRGLHGNTQKTQKFSQITIFPGYSREIPISIDYDEEGIILAFIDRGDKVKAGQIVINN